MGGLSNKYLGGTNNIFDDVRNSFDGYKLDVGLRKIWNESSSCGVFHGTDDPIVTRAN